MNVRTLARNASWLVLGFALLGPWANVAMAAPRAARHTLEVFAAASLADAFTEIARTLERRQPGLQIHLNLAGSQLLAAQIEQGAAADVFASADERWMEDVRQQGLIAGEAVTFARNRLVVIVPRTNPARIRELRDLARAGVKLVLGADAVPVGRYSRAVIRNLGRDSSFRADFATRVLRNVVSQEENVKSVVGKVQLGEADAGLVYRSDVTPGVARYLRVFEIPEGANVLASYPIALLKDGREAAAARAFVDYVLSPDGQRTLEGNGLIAVTGQGR
jgi:molybdate transport system substrate-binding protein